MNLNSQQRIDARAAKTQGRVALDKNEGPVKCQLENRDLPRLSFRARASSWAERQNWFGCCVCRRCHRFGVGVCRYRKNTAYANAHQKASQFASTRTPVP